MKGLLGKEIQPDRRFGTELSDRVKSIVGLSGIIHSDEDLKKYGFSSEEIKIFNDKLQVGENDAFILILGSKAKINRTWPVIKERILEALVGVPPETRKALENGNTTFLRGLHGGSRLYPDTDSRSIPIGPSLIESIPIPPKPWDIIEDITKKYKLDSSRVEQLILDGYLSVFNEIIENVKVSPSLVLNTFLDTLTALSREGCDVELISDMHFINLFKAIASSMASKEAIEDILKAICKDPSLTIDKATEKLNISAMSVDELRLIIKKVIKDNEALIKEKKERAFSPLMGSVMKEARGNIDGKIVSQELKKELNKKLKA